MRTTKTHNDRPPDATTYAAISGGDAALGALALVEGAGARLDRFDDDALLWLYACVMRHRVLLELAPRRFDAPGQLHDRLAVALDALEVEAVRRGVGASLHDLVDHAIDWRASMEGALEGALRLAESDAGVVDDATTLARAALTAGELHPAWSGRE